MRRVTHWIDGKPWDGVAERTGEVFDPASGQLTARVDMATRAVVDAAVAAGSAAGGQWAASSVHRRSRVLFAFRQLLHARADELAGLVTDEHGKTLADARGEVARGLEVVEFACGLGQLLRGEFVAEVATGVDTHSVRRPLGVVAVMSPFNFPVMVPLWFVPLAVACGNAVVLKPSELDPTPAGWLAELWAEAGLPPGVLNVVHGDAPAVDRLLEHPDVAAVSFVGSTPVARHVYRAAAAAGKRVQALGGAKNHMVVLPDADLESAADAAVSAAFGSTGQRCMAVSVVVAVDPVGDALVPMICQRAAGLRVGDGRRDVDLGPLATGAHRERVTGYLAAGTAAGAQLVLDGRGVRPDGEPGGYWCGPSVFDRVTVDMPVYREEIFGPVLCVLRVPDYPTAVRLVNANPYGNGTAVFTRDGGAARRYAAEVQVGMVGVNVPIPVPAAFFSFGGWKSSLFGDAHVYGTDGVRFYTREQVVTSRWPAPAGPQLDLGFPTGG